MKGPEWANAGEMIERSSNRKTRFSLSSVEIFPPHWNSIVSVYNYVLVDPSEITIDFLSILSSLASYILLEGHSCNA